MAKPLEALSGWLTETYWPRVLCPDCLEGSLGYESTIKHLDQESEAAVAQTRRGGLQEELSGTFVGAVKCDNTSCARRAAVAGEWCLSWDYDDVEEREGLFDQYRLRYIDPAPRLLLTPKRTPAKVVSAIELASSILWASPDLAATQLRLAVEELLTARRVPRFEVSKKGRRRRLSAQERLSRFKNDKPEVVVVLEAVKWIGNTGTHEEGLSVEDVVKGAKFLEHALRRLYDTSEQELLAQAKRINRSRGLPAAK